LNNWPRYSAQVLRKELRSTNNQISTYSRRFKMQVSKLIVALTVAAGFTSASFAQGNATLTAPATPAAKASAPAPATTEKKIEAPKAAEPVKAEAAKSAAPAKSEAVKNESPKAGEAKPAEHHDKAKDHTKKAEHKPEVKAEAKPGTPAPTSK
jgi:hypothetical protein